MCILILVLCLDKIWNIECFHTVKNSNSYCSSVLKFFISKVLSKRKSRAGAQHFILSVLNWSALQELKCKPPRQTLSL